MTRPAPARASVPTGASAAPREAMPTPGALLLYVATGALLGMVFVKRGLAQRGGWHMALRRGAVATPALGRPRHASPFFRSTTFTADLALHPEKFDHGHGNDLRAGGDVARPATLFGNVRREVGETVAPGPFAPFTVVEPRGVKVAVKSLCVFYSADLSGSSSYRRTRSIWIRDIRSRSRMSP